MRHVRIIAIAALFAITFSLVPAGTGQALTQGAQARPESANFADWLTEAVEAYLANELAGPEQAIESMQVTVPARYGEPPGYDSFEMSIPKQSRKGSNVFVLVTFSKDGRAVSRLNVIAAVKVKRDVVVARRSINRGVLIGEGDLDVETRTTGPFTGRYISDKSQAIGRQAERSIRQGTAIQENQVSWPKMVRTGDKVSVIAESGAMRITILATAKQSGDRGDWIKVVNNESKRTISARVTGPGEVRVEF